MLSGVNNNHLVLINVLFNQYNNLVTSSNLIDQVKLMNRDRRALHDIWNPDSISAYLLEMANHTYIIKVKAFIYQLQYKMGLGISIVFYHMDFHSIIKPEI